MAIDPWVKELQRVEQAFYTLNMKCSEKSQKSYFSLACKSKLLNQKKESLQGLCSRPFEGAKTRRLSGGQGEAIIQRLTEVIRRSRRIAGLASRIEIQNLWIRLLRRRYLRDENLSEKSYIEADEISKIHSKSQSLHTMQLFLQEQADKLAGAEGKLRQSYESLVVEEANFEAAHSLQYGWENQDVQEKAFAKLKALLIGVELAAVNHLSHHWLAERSSRLHSISSKTISRYESIKRLTNRNLSEEDLNSVRRAIAEARSLIGQLSFLEKSRADHKPKLKLRNTVQLQKSNAGVQIW